MSLPNPNTFGPQPSQGSYFSLTQWGPTTQYAFNTPWSCTCHSLCQQHPPSSLIATQGTPTHPVKPISNTSSSVNSFPTTACWTHLLNNRIFYLMTFIRQKKVLAILQSLLWREHSNSPQGFPPFSEFPLVSFPALIDNSFRWTLTAQQHMSTWEFL